MKKILKQFGFVLVVAVGTQFPMVSSAHDTLELNFMAIFGEEEFVSNLERPKPEPKPIPHPPLMDLTIHNDEYKDNNSIIRHQSILKLSLRAGHWLPHAESTTLVVAELESPGHAGGLFHCLVTIVDSTTMQRLTPVLHYISDSGAFSVASGKGRDVLILIGHRAGQCEWFTDDSQIVTFATKEVHIVPAIGDLSPGQYRMVVENHQYALDEVFQIESKEFPHSVCTDKGWRRWNAVWQPEKETFSFDSGAP